VHDCFAKRYVAASGRMPEAISLAEIVDGNNREAHGLDYIGEAFFHSAENADSQPKKQHTHSERNQEGRHMQ